MGLERSGSRLMRSVSFFPRKQVDPSDLLLLHSNLTFLLILHHLRFLHSLHPAPDLGFTPAKFQCEYCSVLFFDPSRSASFIASKVRQFTLFAPFPS